MHFCVANEVPYYKGHAVNPTRLVVNKTLSFAIAYVRFCRSKGTIRTPGKLQTQVHRALNSTFPNGSRVVALRLQACRILPLRLTPKPPHKKSILRRVYYLLSRTTQRSCSPAG